MKTIVFINCNKAGSSREAIRAAEQMGYYTVLLTDKSKFIEERELFPEVKLMIKVNLKNMNQLRMAIRNLIQRSFNVKCIISFVDQYCYVAAKLADEFGINRFSTKAILTMEDKILSRKAIIDSPYSPHYMKLSPNRRLNPDRIKNHFPLMLKSPSSAGSKDVFKVNSMEELNYYRSKLSQKHPNESLILEDFLDGPQYLVECVVIDGDIHIVAIVEQEVTFQNRFIITGYSLLIDPDPTFYKSISKAATDIIGLHGMKTGTCHLEMRYVKDQWKLIETNPRISGSGMNDFIQVGLGINLVKETLKLAMGQEPDLNFRRQKQTFAQYVTVNQTGRLEKVVGKNEAINSPQVHCVYIQPKRGTLLVPPRSMGNRYAYVIATGETKEEAKKNAKNAAAKIQFILSPRPNVGE